MTDLYKKDLQAHQMSYDAMPDERTTRKYKRRERQRGKKECRKYFDGTDKTESEDFNEHLAHEEKNKYAGSSFEDFMKED